MPLPAGFESAEAEFRGAQLPDARLDKRLVKIAATMAEAPAKSFAAMSRWESEREGLYRFLSNDRVTFEGIIAKHVELSCERAQDAKAVLVLHDTSTFIFDGERGEELGYVNTGKRGFFLHAAVGVVAEGESRECLGVLGARVLFRDKPPAKRRTSKKRSGRSYAGDPERESTRWWTQIDEVEGRLAGRAKLVHVADSEGDKYELLEKLVRGGRRFVTRMAREHRARTGDEEWSCVTALIGSAEDVAERTVPLPRRSSKRPPTTSRKFPPREGRTASLRFGKTVLKLKRPPYLGKDISPEVEVNVVRVYEVNAPEGIEPVEWVLFTSEPIESKAHVLAVVDAYRKRWVIEDYFRALKTGTAFEARQLEGRQAWLNALALSMPIAWRLMAIRYAARTAPDAPATDVFTDSELTVLRHHFARKFPENPTRRQAMLALAEMGGHVKSNGDPGWQVLLNGFSRLMPRAEGLELAREM